MKCFEAIAVCSLVYMVQPNEHPKRHILNMRNGLMLEITIVGLLLYLFPKYIANPHTRNIGLITGIFLFEHVRQFTLCYRTRGGSLRDWCTLMLHAIGASLSLDGKHYIPMTAFMCGLAIHGTSIMYRSTDAPCICATNVLQRLRYSH